MAKKNKDDIPNPTSISNRDIIQRLNFLYQASTYLNNITLPPNPESTPSTSASDANDKTRKTRNSRKKDRRRVVTRSELSRTYVESMRTVGQKTIVKMDPSVKRTLCKGCQLVLVPGLTAKVRVKASRSHGHMVTYICTECKTSRRIPAPPTLHEPAADNKEVQVTLSQEQVPQEVQEPPDHPQLGQAMDIDHETSKDDPSSTKTADQTVPTKRQNHRKTKKSAAPRLAPHFARKVGHVVFRGNERLPESET